MQGKPRQFTVHSNNSKFLNKTKNGIHNRLVITRGRRETSFGEGGS